MNAATRSGAGSPRQSPRAAIFESIASEAVSPLILVSLVLVSHPSLRAKRSNPVSRRPLDCRGLRPRNDGGGNPHLLPHLLAGQSARLRHPVGEPRLVEPTGAIEDDPDLTDKEFPGNPTLSCRFREPLGAIGEVAEWQGHPPEQLKARQDHLERLKAHGIEAID